MNGAFTVGAAATITLTNGTKSCNVFWIINGAISVAAAADLKGTLFSKGGAVGLGAGALLEGRMLTLGGAITLGIGAIATPPPCVSTIPIFCEAGCSPAPAVDVLGSLSNFTLFASVGNVGNTGISGMNGNIGTNAGAITGYTNGIHIGTEQIMNTVTAQAALDLDAAYIALMALTPTGAGSATYLNETITPGVYAIPTAGALGGTITLDAGGNPNAIFVFRFAGAFNIAAASKMILANGARRCNIFWLAGAGVATGALNIGASAEIKGNFIAHGGACNSGGGVFMSGRQFSTLGAVNTDNAVIYNNPECVTSTSLAPAPAVALVKTASVSGTGTVGNVITYTFTVTNTGNTTLTNVAVTDPMVGLTITGSPIASLAPGASSSVITGTYTITEANVTAGSVSNTATVNTANGVSDISGTTITNNTATVTATPTPTLIPAVALVKTANVSGTGTVGNVITYTFTVTNTGNTTLTNVAVTDPMVGLTITGSPIASLAPGASSSTITGTYTITQADVNAGTVTNSATVTAQDPGGSNVTDISGTAIDNDISTITTLNQTSAVALVKTASIGGTGIIGEVITYTFTVTNTGNTTLTNLTVTDPMVGLTISGSPIAVLEVGISSSIITGTYTITQADINAGGVTNSALVTAKDPNGIDVIDISGTANDNNTQTVTPLTFSPAITLVKTASVSGTGIAGNVITYIFTVKNIGNITLTNVLLTDPMEGLTFLGNPIASLAPDAIAIAIATYTITQANIDTGSITNSALVTAKDPNGNDVTDISGTSNDNNTPTVTTTAPPVPVLPDFTPTIDINGLLFSSAGDTKDFVVNISEINGVPSTGLIVLKIPKQSAFNITYEASASTSGGLPVNNNDWIITEDSLFITVTLKSGVIIGTNTSSKIGFTIERKSDIPTQTTQSITVTIVEGSGLDGQSYNNTYSTIIKAQ
jgi:uncharacterized repeat protein (TIGR01451 family)